MAVRTLKGGESRFEYVISRKELIANKPQKKKDVHPINIVLPKGCYCAALEPRTKALIILREKKIAKKPKRVSLTEKSVVFRRKDVSANLLKDALKKCPQ